MSESKSDLLDMDYINSLPQLWTSDGWPVHDIEVQTGLFRIDAYGMLDVRHIGREILFTDECGKTHWVGDFYLDPESWEERVPA